MTSKDRMSIQEVSEYVGISPNTLQRKSWRMKKDFPLEKIGKDLISYRPILDRWIEKTFHG